MALTFTKKFYFKGKSKTKHPAYKFRRKKNTLYCFYCPNTYHYKTKHEILHFNRTNKERQ